MRSVVAVALLSLLFPFLAGCTGGEADGEADGDGPVFVAPPTDADGAHVITLTGAPAFDPSHAVVPAGATVVFRSQVDGCDVRSDGAGGPDSRQSQYGNGLIPRGGACTWTAPAGEAEFAVHCTLHEGKGMTGVVRVA